MSNKVSYNDVMAGVVIELYDDGVCDPSAEEIAARYYDGTGMVYGQEVVAGIRGRLSPIRRALEQQGYLTHLVAPYYYRRARGRIDSLELKDLRACLPIGRHRKAAGVRLLPKDVSPSSDPLYVQYLGWDGSTSAGKLEKYTTRVGRCVDQGVLTVDQATDLLESALRVVGKDSRALVTTALQRLIGP